MRLLWTTIALAIAICIPFAIFGEDFIRLFSGEAAVAWIRGWGPWGWCAVIGLLVSDLFLPIPATPVMSASGFIYGTALGGLLNALGSFAAGLAGYGLCRSLGKGIAVKLAGKRELADHQTLFQRSGPWLVAASRWLPVLPEVVSCLAGLTRMPFPIFAASLACGALPMGFVYAAIGAAGHDDPKLALLLSIVVPPLLWLIARRVIPSRGGYGKDGGDRT
jgi:uncharacterized membrane protein YdjX (TVP38/TMEM64 family)